MFIFEKLMLYIQPTGLVNWAKLFIISTNNKVGAFPVVIGLTYK